MKQKIFVGILALLFLSVIGASMSNAAMYNAETGPYYNTNGKKLLLYGDVIKSIALEWWNFDNASQFNETVVEGVNDTTYIYTVVNLWNCSYIRWEATVTDISDTAYHFEGGFSTIVADYAQTDLTNYNLIQSMQTSLKDDLIMWLRANETYSRHFDDLERDVIQSVDNLMGTYNEGLVAELKSVGLTDTQIKEIMDSVVSGFESTLRDSKQQDLEIAKAQESGFTNGVKTAGIFIGVAIVVTFLVLLFKGRLGFIGHGL